MTACGDWRTRAACRREDPRLFDPLDGKNRNKWGGTAATHPTVLSAKKVCAHCPVQAVCLDDGLATDASGVRGGEYLTAARRAELREAAA